MNHDHDHWKVIDLDRGHKVLLRADMIEDTEDSWSIRGVLYVPGTLARELQLTWSDDRWDWELDGQEWAPNGSDEAFRLEDELDRMRLA